MAGILDLMGHIQQQGQLGREQGNARGLAGLLSKGMTAAPQDRQAMVAKAMAIDPKGAMAAQQHFGQMSEDALDQFGKLSTAYAQTRDPMLAREWARRGVAAGMLPPEAAQKDFTDPADIEGSSKAAQAFAQAFGQGGGMPAGIQEFQYMAQGLSPEDQLTARRIGLGLDPRASSAAIQYKEVEGPDGRKRWVAMDPREVGAQVIGGGQMYGSGVRSGGDPFGFLADAGATVTSGQRSPEHNAKVGGVPNSFHLSGQARDILPPTDPQQAAMIRQQAAANGLEVIDEGDHWHLEPRGNAPRVDPFTSRRPEDEAYATEAAKVRAGLDLSSQQAVADADRARQVKQAELDVQFQSDLREKAPKARRALETARTATGHVVRAIEQALPNVGVWTAGTIGTPLVNLPGSAAADLRATLATIESNIAFDRLQQMRDNSVTGGALGQVSERELDLLASTITSIKQAQSPEQLTENLRYLAQQYPAALQAMEQAYQQDYGARQESGPNRNDIQPQQFTGFRVLD